MTTTDPREAAPVKVRVAWRPLRVAYDSSTDESTYDGYAWHILCPGCKTESTTGTWSLRSACRDAHRHAATCPGLRLARLLRDMRSQRERLESLVNEYDGKATTYLDEPRTAAYYRGLCNGYGAAEVRLSALIDRATDGAA